MDIQQLKYFLTICETSSATETARMYSVSRQAIYRSIHRLEKELGAVLLENRNGHANPTEFGRSIIGPSSRLVSLVENAPQYINFDSPSHLVLGIDSITVGKHTQIHGIIEEYEATERGCDIVIYQEDYDLMHDGILEKRFDLCLLRSARRVFPRCETRILREGRLAIRLSCRHPQSHLSVITMRDLESFPFLAHGGESDRYLETFLLKEWDTTNLDVVTHIDTPVLFDDALRYRHLAAFSSLWDDDRLGEQDGIVKIPLVGDGDAAIYDEFVYLKESPKVHQVENFIDFLMDENRWKRMGLSNV